MAEKPFKDRCVLITGGSSGIGFEFAKLFLEEGAKIILVASDSGKLAKAADSLRKEFRSEPLLIAKDLSRPGIPREIFDELSSQGISPDILVNNAGIGVSGKFHNMDLEKSLRMIDVNVKALVSLTHLFILPMVQRGFGRLLNVASTAAFQPVPIEAVYAASKAFVLHFSEALSSELAGTGVQVTCLCPGPTDTPFFGASRVVPSKMVKKNMMPSRAVAETGMRALKENRDRAIPGLRNKAIPFLERMAPRKLVTKLARRMVE